MAVDSFSRNTLTSGLAPNDLKRKGGNPPFFDVAARVCDLARV